MTTKDDSKTCPSVASVSFTLEWMESSGDDSTGDTETSANEKREQLLRKAALDAARRRSRARAKYYRHLSDLADQVPDPSTMGFAKRGLDDAIDLTDEKDETSPKTAKTAEAENSTQSRFYVHPDFQPVSSQSASQSYNNLVGKKSTQ